MAKDVPPLSMNLADSISEAAQLFAHEEITRKESTEAYRAFQSSVSHASKDNDYVPGGLDAARDDPEALPDMDPTGISMFASMFEYLLSQFTFSAKDISITVIHPGHSSFRFKVSELRYGRPTSGRGESTRTVDISGVEIAHCDLSTSDSPASGHSESRPLPSAPREFNATSRRVDDAALSSKITSSSSPPPSFIEGRSGSNDTVSSADPSVPEDHSGPSSPSGSTTSSIFKSALTTQGSKLEHGSCQATVAHSQDIRVDNMEPNPNGCMLGDSLLSQAGGVMEDRLYHRVIISLATEPIIIHITTSAPPVSPRTSAQAQSTPHTSESGTSGPDSPQPTLEISVSVGIVACAFTPAQINAILCIISTIGSHSGPSTQPQVSSNAGLVVPSLSLLDQATFTMQIRGLVSLLQSVPAPLMDPLRDIPLTDFFTHPLTPPKIDHGYIRFLIDRLKADLSVSTTLEQLADEPTSSSDHLPERSRVPRVVRRTTSFHTGFSVGDLSAFAFCMPSSATTPPAAHEAFVIPIVLTDPSLVTQYHPEYYNPPNMEHHLNFSSEFTRKAFPALPEFEILDWTSENNRTSQAKLSLWRVKPPPSHRRSQRNHAGDPLTPPPVLSSPKTVSEETLANKPRSALTGRVLLSSTKDPGMGGPPESMCSIHIDIIPLHVFVDMGSIATALDFMEILSVRCSCSASDVTFSRSGSSEPKGEDHEGARRRGSSGDLTPLSSPHGKTLQRIHQQELEDLNLSVDYLSKEPPLGVSSPGLKRIHKQTQV